MGPVPSENITCTGEDVELCASTSISTRAGRLQSAKILVKRYARALSIRNRADSHLAYLHEWSEPRVERDVATSTCRGIGFRLMLVFAKLSRGSVRSLRADVGASRPGLAEPTYIRRQLRLKEAKPLVDRAMARDRPPV